MGLNLIVLSAYDNPSGGIVFKFIRNIVEQLGNQQKNQILLLRKIHTLACLLAM